MPDSIRDSAATRSQITNQESPITNESPIKDRESRMIYRPNSNAAIVRRSRT
jgi:hypothetical protein